MIAESPNAVSYPLYTAINAEACFGTDTPGTVVLRSGYTPRFHETFGCWHALRVPVGSQRQHRGQLEVARSLNVAIQHMTGDWLWIMDDDHTFEPTILTDLLRTMRETGADVVVPLVLLKAPPYQHVLFGPAPPGEQLPRIDLADKGPVVDVHACGMPGMLIHKRVFDRLDRPIFRVGQIDMDRYQEDIYFCLRVRAAGFRIVCDTRQRLGHLNHIGVYPHVMPDGSVQAFLDLGNGRLLEVDESKMICTTDTVVGPQWKE